MNEPQKIKNSTAKLLVALLFGLPAAEAASGALGGPVNQAQTDKQEICAEISALQAAQRDNEETIAALQLSVSKAQKDIFYLKNARGKPRLNQSIEKVSELSRTRTGRGIRKHH